MNDENIVKNNAVVCYIDRLLQTILNIKFKQIDTTDLAEYIGVLLEPENNSLLKQQLIRFSAVGLEHIEQSNAAINIDIEKMYNSVRCSDISYSGEDYERRINVWAMSTMNLSYDKIIDEKMILSRQNAERLIDMDKKRVTEDIEIEVKKWNIEELFYTVFGISSVLAKISSIIYSRLVLKELPIDVNTQAGNGNLIIETILAMSEQELKIVSFLIGQEKMNSDFLFNIVRNMYCGEVRISGEAREDNDILELYTRVSVLTKMQLYQESVALLYEKKHSLYIQDYIIGASDDFQEHLLKYLDEIISYHLPGELDNELQEKYTKCLGYSARDLLKFCSCLANSFLKSNISGLQIISYEEKALIDEISNVCQISECGAKKLIEAIMLSDSNKKVDYKNKLSNFPLVKHNNRILVSVPLLVQAYPMLEKRMSQRSFSKNRRMHKYFENVYDEFFIEKIEDALREKKITCQRNVNLDQISDKRVKQLFEKGITREFDLVFGYNETLYVVEYKNWALSAFSIRNMLNEYKKVENVVKEHLKAFDIIKEHRDTYQTVFKCKKEVIDNMRLIMVFQKPNAYYYLSNEYNVLAYSVNDFIENVANHFDNKTE